MKAENPLIKIRIIPVNLVKLGNFCIEFYGAAVYLKQILPIF